MIYEKYEGNNISVQIENVDERNPYTGIGAKAFLSCKNVYEIMLPDTICEIGAWAFAHMKELKRINVPAKKISFGKDVFLDCDNLTEIIVYPDESGNQGLSCLLASCITILNTYELLDFEIASKQNEAWCDMYDRELVRFISQTDDMGFQPVMVGWFNDEGEDVQLQRHIRKSKENKIKLSFLRLKNDAYVKSDTKETILAYLRSQIKQLDEGDDLAWEILRDVLAQDLQYAKLAVANELLNEELLLKLIKYLNDNNASTELVAHLVLALEEKNENIDQQFDL